MLKSLTTIPTAHGDRRGFTGLQMAINPGIAKFVKDNPEIFMTAVNIDAAIVNEP